MPEKMERNEWFESNKQMNEGRITKEPKRKEKKILEISAVFSP